jgi:hypothetical protein
VRVCEYVGCQDVPAIAALNSEHDQIREVARDPARAAIEGDRLAAAHAAARLLAVLALLGPHTEIEERALFPAMAVEFADHVDCLPGDHRRIEVASPTIADRRGAAEGWVKRLGATLAELFTHILRGQDGLFPATLSVRTPDQWATLGQVRARVAARNTFTVRVELPALINFGPGLR